MKKIIIIILLLFNINFVYGAFNLNIFNNSMSSEELPMGDNGFITNYTRYLTFPKLSKINYAWINITGIYANYSIYDEIDYFQSNTYRTDYWSFKTTVGEDSSISTTFSNYMLIQAAETGGSGTGTARNVAYLNESSAILNLNFSTNFSILIDFDYYVTASASGATASSAAAVIFLISNSTDNLITDGIAIYSKSVSQIATGTKLNQGSEIYRFDYNTTDDAIFIYSSDGVPVNKIDVSNKPGDKYFKFYTFANKVTGGAEGAYSTARLIIHNIGVNKNRNQYTIWNESQGEELYKFKYYVSDKLAYYNTTKIDSEILIDFGSNLTESLNSGSCDCVGCISDLLYCSVPTYFSSYNGSLLNYTNLIVNYNLTTANMTVTLYDSDSLNIITGTNISVELIGSIFQFLNVTDTGTAFFSFPFNDTNTDTISLNSYSTDINDYSIIIRNMEVVQGGNYAVSLYLTNTSDTTKVKEVTFKVKDENKNNLEGALIKIYKRNPSTNTFLEITDITTNPNGEATTKLIKDTVFYKFVVIYNENQVYVSSQPYPVSSSDDIITLNCVVGEAYSDYLIKLLNFDGLFLFTRTTNQTGYYSITYLSQNEVEVCINSYYYINTVYFDNGEVCLNTTSGILTSNIMNVSKFADVYGELYLDFNDNQGKVKITTLHSYLGLDILKSSQTGRLFILFGLIILSGVAFVYFPIIGLIVMAVGTLVISFTKFTLITPTWAMFVVSLCIFVIITLSKNEK